MENKKDLAKIALTALILASASPIVGHAADVEVKGIVLAAGCPAHGCGGKSSSTNGQINNNSYYDPSLYNQNSRDYGNQQSGMTDYKNGNVIQNDYRDRSAATNPNESTNLTEVQLLGMLNPQGRAIYLSFDPETKALAIQLASQDSYRDKNLAVKEAQRRMNERRSINR